MEKQDRETFQAHRLCYRKPMCSMIEIKELEMIASSPDPTTPSEPSLKPPSSTGEKEDVTDPNPAKKYPGFNAWQTWE